MTNKNYSKHIIINADPEMIFTAITQEIDKWWTESSNKILKVGDQLTIQFEEATAWTMNVIDLRKYLSTEWQVINAEHNLENLSKKDEWEGTVIKWKITENENGTILSLIHEGLDPTLECYDICKDGWDFFLNSLKLYLETGTGTPYKKS